MRRSIFVAALVVFVCAGISFGGTTVAYYRFEEGTAGQPATGTILDSSGNGLNGTALNGPVYSSNVPIATIPQTGAPDNLSMSFDGLFTVEDQVVAIPDSTPFQLTQSVTVEAYVYCTGAVNSGGAGGLIFYRGDNRPQNDPYTLFVNAPGTAVGFSINNTATVAATIPLNQWIFLAGELDADTGLESLYVDGVLQDSMTTSQRPVGPLIAGDDPCESIGGLGYLPGSGANEVFPGYIDEVRISNTALTPDQFLDSVPVPEPTMGSLLLIATAGMLLRRRQRQLA